MVGELAVAVDRFANGPEYFHPRCLICSQCGILLVDLRCFVDVGRVRVRASVSPRPHPMQEERSHRSAEQRLFCGRHWADNRKARCALACHLYASLP